MVDLNDFLENMLKNTKEIEDEIAYLKEFYCIKCGIKFEGFRLTEDREKLCSSCWEDRFGESASEAALEYN